MPRLRSVSMSPLRIQPRTRRSPMLPRMRLAARGRRGVNHYATTVSPAYVADHHDDLLEAVVLLGEMLGVDWEDG